jgi:hypothetical protein
LQPETAARRAIVGHRAIPRQANPTAVAISPRWRRQHRATLAAEEQFPLGRRKLCLTIHTTWRQQQIEQGAAAPPGASGKIMNQLTGPTAFGTRRLLHRSNIGYERTNLKDRELRTPLP